MKKEFVPFQTAKKLRAIGFDESCCAFYEEDRVVTKPEMVDDKDQYRVSGWRTCKNSEVPGHYFAAATFSQAFRWFREKYDWQHSIDPTADQHSHKLGYNYWIWNYKTGEEHYTMPKNRPTGDWEYETYEQAEIACLDKLLEIVEFKSE